jgi:hypothetical protein
VAGDGLNTHTHTHFHDFGILEWFGIYCFQSVFQC